MYVCIKNVCMYIPLLTITYSYPLVDQCIGLKCLSKILYLVLMRHTVMFIGDVYK